MTGLSRWARGYVRGAFEGGNEGRRRVVLVFLVVYGPFGTLGAFIFGGSNHLPQLVVRVLVLTLVIAWLALRRPPGSVEWVALWTLVIVSWTAGQVASGPLYNGAWAVNGVAALTILSIAFDLPMIAFVAVTGWVAYTGVQLHFHPAGKALTVAAMLASIEVLVVLVVYGTATFLRDSLRDVGILHARMAETADRERARIASELHDDTLQALAAAALRLDRLATGPAPQDVAAVTREVREMITGAADRARRLSFDLYPPELVHRGLAPALSALGGQIASESTFQVDVEATRARYPAEAERLVYRTIRELLINAQKHSDATRVVVTVAASDGRVRGRVEDDGRGFGEEELMSARRQLHVGLDAANERIKLAGGESTSAPRIRTALRRHSGSLPRSSRRRARPTVDGPTWW